MAYLSNGKYWIRSVRRGDRTTTEYLGSDALAAFVAGMDAEGRARREAERLERLEAEERTLAMAVAEAIRGRGIRRSAEAVLFGLGYRRPRRGRWRRRRMGRGDIEVTAPPPSRDILALYERARAGEDGALAAFTALAREHPRPVAQATGASLQRAARRVLADQVAKDPAIRAAFVARVEALEAELIPDGCGIATKLLASVVAQAHNEWWALCAAGAKRLTSAGPAELRREHAALRRYLGALRSYAQIERLEGGGT
jgi:hypothetical protein